MEDVTKPTEPDSRQRAVIKDHMLLPEHWMVEKEDRQYLYLIYKHGKSRKKLKKGVNLWQKQ